MLLSATTLAMWMKVVNFLRLYETTGFLIRAMIVSIFDMRYFLLITGITIVAFGDAFLRIS